MRRTELIPRSTAAINAGQVYYHFSIQRTAVNPPPEFREHQIAFFESHFTSLKAGWISGEAGTSDPLLGWDINSQTQWNTTDESVEFYHSTRADDLMFTIPAVKVTSSSNGEDWDLDVLELPRHGYTDLTEDIYFSGVYVDSSDTPSTPSAALFNPISSATASATIEVSTAIPITLSTIVSPSASSCCNVR